MQADYDSQANAISMILADSAADASDEVHPRAIVALAAGRPVELQLLYPSQGIEQPLAAAAERYQLGLEALQAAAQSALAAPDRMVSIDIASRSAA